MPTGFLFRPPALPLDRNIPYLALIIKLTDPYKESVGQQSFNTNQQTGRSIIANQETGRFITANQQADR